MNLREVLQRVAALLPRPHGDVLSFEREVEAAGVAGRAEGAMRTIPAAKVVGSVRRAEAPRSDCFSKSGKTTGRFSSIGRAMERGVTPSPIEVYAVRVPRPWCQRETVVTEYYVADGHHRVAMACKLGQDFLDAHVVDYRPRPGAPIGATTPAAAGPVDRGPGAAYPVPRSPGCG